MSGRKAPGKLAQAKDTQKSTKRTTAIYRRFNYQVGMTDVAKSIAVSAAKTNRLNSLHFLCCHPIDAANYQAARKRTRRLPKLATTSNSPPRAATYRCNVERR
jgi:hypothetical protein